MKTTRELDLIKSLESDNRELELLALYFEEAVTEVSFLGGPSMSGREKAKQLRARIAENKALIDEHCGGQASDSLTDSPLRILTSHWETEMVSFGARSTRMKSSGR